MKRTQILALALALSLAGAGQGSFLPGLGADAWARDVAAEPLTVRVVVRPYLYLEIGSPGGIVDTVNFTVAGLPGSGPVPGQSTGANPVPVWAEGLVRSATTVMLTADSSRPLEDGSNNQIPFSQFYWQGSGGVPSGRFTGNPQQVILQQTIGKGFFRLMGGMAFFYENVNYYPVGNYRSKVTYTLSTP